MRFPILATAVTAALLSFGASPSFAQSAAKAECKPSKWGAVDELGSANLVAPERTKAALSLVKTGKSHPLGIVIDSSTPAFPPRTLSMQVVQPNQQGGARLFGYDGSYNDDLLQTWVGIGSQIDGLGHLGEKGMYYNCNDEKDFAAITGLKKLGVHNVPPLVGRGVLIDMAKHNKLTADPKAWGGTEPGLGESGATWMASKNVMAVGADTWGLEPVPPEKEGRPFYGHVIPLKNNGIYILETMNTGPLAKEGVHEFMFVLGQMRVRGSVQAIINPVALY